MPNSVDVLAFSLLVGPVLFGMLVLLVGKGIRLSRAAWGLLLQCIRVVVVCLSGAVAWLLVHLMDLEAWLDRLSGVPDPPIPPMRRAWSAPVDDDLRLPLRTGPVVAKAFASQAPNENEAQRRLSNLRRVANRASEAILELMCAMPRGKTGARLEFQSGPGKMTRCLVSWDEHEVVDGKAVH